jgi:hypothetical protein
MKRKTVHVHRTIMSNELEKVMDFGLEGDEYQKALESNVFEKKSADGVKQTSTFLTRIYSFDSSLPQFRAFKYFWKICSHSEKPQLAFLYAFLEDYLLFESLEVVRSHKPGEKAAVEDFKENLVKYYPNKYSKVTSHSIGKNLASSWKQAGFIEGKTKNIRVQPEISYRVAAFAFFLAYLQGARGEFILSNPVVKSLCLRESELRELAIEAAKQDLLQYQFGGNVTSFAFPQLLSKLEIQA